MLLITLSYLSLTKSYIHSVLARRHIGSTELSHTDVTALIVLPHIVDDDASLMTAAVAHTGGQRSPITGLQSHLGELGVSHKTGDGTVLS